MLRALKFRETPKLRKSTLFLWNAVIRVRSIRIVKDSDYRDVPDFPRATWKF